MRTIAAVTLIFTFSFLITSSLFAKGDPAACPGGGHRERFFADKKRHRGEYFPARKVKHHKHSFCSGQKHFYKK